MTTLNNRHQGAVKALLALAGFLGLAGGLLPDASDLSQLMYVGTAVCVVLVGAIVVSFYVKEPYLGGTVRGQQVVLFGFLFGLTAGLVGGGVYHWFGLTTVEVNGSSVPLSGTLWWVKIQRSTIASLFVGGVISIAIAKSLSFGQIRAWSGESYTYDVVIHLVIPWLIVIIVFGSFAALGSNLWSVGLYLSEHWPWLSWYGAGGCDSVGQFTEEYRISNCDQGPFLIWHIAVTLAVYLGLHATWLALRLSRKPVVKSITTGAFSALVWLGFAALLFMLGSDGYLETDRGGVARSIAWIALIFVTMMILYVVAMFPGKFARWLRIPTSRE